MPQSVIQFQEGLLSVQIRDAPWAEVLHTLERQAGLTIQVKGQLAGTVSLEFEALPLEQGLRWLFRDADALLVHTPGTQEGGTPQIMIRVWSFSKEGATAPSKNAKPPRRKGRWAVRTW
jgi:hypothetical protein